LPYRIKIGTGSFLQKLRNDETTKQLNDSTYKNINLSTNNSMKKISFSIMFLLFIQMVNAQCAMCRAVVESGRPEEAEGLNKGILYLMMFPYILIGILFFFIIKHKIAENKKNKI
jgi:hypothetical protein